MIASPRDSRRIPNTLFLCCFSSFSIGRIGGLVKSKNENKNDRERKPTRNKISVARQTIVVQTRWTGTRDYGRPLLPLPRNVSASDTSTGGVCNRFYRPPRSLISPNAAFIDPHVGRRDPSNGREPARAVFIVAKTIGYCFSSECFYYYCYFVRFHVLKYQFARLHTSRRLSKNTRDDCKTVKQCSLKIFSNHRTSVPSEGRISANLRVFAPVTIKVSRSEHGICRVG